MVGRALFITLFVLLPIGFGISLLIEKAWWWWLIEQKKIPWLDTKRSASNDYMMDICGIIAISLGGLVAFAILMGLL
jgi:hypothetical protein